MEQNERARDNQDGNDFSHLQESFEPVGFDDCIAVFNRVVLVIL